MFIAEFGVWAVKPCVLPYFISYTLDIEDPNVNNVKFTPNFSAIHGEFDNIFPEYIDLLNTCQYRDSNSNFEQFKLLNAIFIVHVNIRSLPKNFENLQLFLHQLSTKPHIILVSETWVDPAHVVPYELQNYRLECTSPPATRGKGAAIYIIKSLAYIRRSDLEIAIPQHQSVFLQFTSATNEQVIVGSTYRSPSFPPAVFSDYLESTLDKINAERAFCVVGGDMNMDIAKHAMCDSTSQFLNLLAALEFFPCISLPTRITPQSKTIIDNFFCNDISKISSPSIIRSDLSDHLPICAFINFKTNPHSHLQHGDKHFDFRRTEQLKEKLVSGLANFQEFEHSEPACSKLATVLSSSIAELSIKKPTRRSAPIQPWISYNLLRCINKKNALHKKYVKCPTNQNHLNFKTYRNILTTLLRVAKKDYFQRKLEANKDKPKETWKILLEDILRSKKKILCLTILKYQIQLYLMHPKLLKNSMIFSQT